MTKSEFRRLQFQSSKPLPAVKDKAGKLTKKYSYHDWKRKIAEEFQEVCEEIFVEDKTRIAEELQDLITVCTSFLQFQG
ncbi:MAG: hypothetical protein IJ728_02175 [Selenomonadaceae bacterium]|nr:hypothetical protein [Selenomonadaceae bacterium]